MPSSDVSSSVKTSNVKAVGEDDSKQTITDDNGDFLKQNHSIHEKKQWLAQVDFIVMLILNIWIKTYANLMPWSWNSVNLFINFERGNVDGGLIKWYAAQSLMRAKQEECWKSYWYVQANSKMSTRAKWNLGGSRILLDRCGSSINVNRDRGSRESRKSKFETRVSVSSGSGTRWQESTTGKKDAKKSGGRRE